MTHVGTKSFLESLSRMGTKPVLDPEAVQAVLKQRNKVCMKSDRELFFLLYYRNGVVGLQGTRSQ